MILGAAHKDNNGWAGLTDLAPRRNPISQSCQSVVLISRGAQPGMTTTQIILESPAPGKQHWPGERLFGPLARSTPGQVFVDNRVKLVTIRFCYFDNLQAFGDNAAIGVVLH